MQTIKDTSFRNEIFLHGHLTGKLEMELASHNISFWTVIIGPKGGSIILKDQISLIKFTCEY